MQSLEHVNLYQGGLRMLDPDAISLVAQTVKSLPAAREA